MLSQKRHMFSGGIFPAFTIIELLVVVSIIGLLVTILAPSLNQVRTYTRSVRTAAIIKNVSTGLESFHAEQSIGGDYPPSLWNANGNNPYDATGQKTADPANPDYPKLCPAGGYIACGAQTLLWALTGADMIGTPGFKGNLHDLYAYDLTKNTPANPRFGPYLNVSNIVVQAPQRLAPTLFATCFSLTGNQYVPTLMDDFGNPILYYKADTSKIGMNRYDPNDNLVLTGYQALAPIHPINEYNSSTSLDPNIRPNFYRYIWNPKVSVLYEPHNYDSYILISAGPDGLYGNRDDIANYPLVTENY